MDNLEKPTRNLFFTGKGGVGKTTLACATAIALADRGARVLLVSTDPASNLDEVLGVSLTSSPTAVQAVVGLHALNIDPEAAARAYRELVVGPYRGVLPAAVVASMEEQLSGSCTVEIAAFDEFSRLLGDPDTTANFDHVVFDTAPTGHTLRLLSLPSAWTGFIEANTTGTSCLGPLAGLQRQRELYGATVAALRSPCTEEIAVFRAFAQAVDAGKDGYVVLDTAPTGHTILLLDAALAYHRELSRQATETPTAVRDLLPRLRDPQFTRVLIVTLPEATPVHEAARLEQDLVRAGIRPFAWVINQSLSPLSVRDPVLLARQQHESPYIGEVIEELVARVSVIPWLTKAPIGAERLQAALCGCQDTQPVDGVTNRVACC